MCRNRVDKGRGNRARRQIGILWRRCGLTAGDGEIKRLVAALG